jgi:hypothetical protein
MTHEIQPKIADLEQPQEELSPDRADQAQGGLGLITAAKGTIELSDAKPTIEIGLKSTGDGFIAFDPTVTSG